MAEEQLVFANKRPLGFTGKLLVSWIVQLSIIALIIYWIAGKNGHHAADFQAPVNATASTPAQNHAESFVKKTSKLPEWETLRHRPSLD